MEKFLDEARLLAQFRNTAEIVDVLDFFTENGTAYYYCVIKSCLYREHD
jgi:serine/threonine protein kinase